MTTILLDAGHGGNDLGDAFGKRYEKDDNLRLTLALGDELKKYGYDVIYTRTKDLFVSQNDRINIANKSRAELLLSIHRIIGELVISEAGLGFYVNSLGGIAEEAAVNIAEELRSLEFENYSILERTESFRSVDMPTVLMGIGYLNSEYDNILFDTQFNEIAQVIAKGIVETIPPDQSSNENTATEPKSLIMEEKKPLDLLYTVQVGLFSVYCYAVNMYYNLLNLGYTSQIIFKHPYYAVMVGADRNLEYIAELELCLRQEGFSTIIVTL